MVSQGFLRGPIHLKELFGGLGTRNDNAFKIKVCYIKFYIYNDTYLSKTTYLFKQDGNKIIFMTQYVYKQDLKTAKIRSRL